MCGDAPSVLGYGPQGLWGPSLAATLGAARRLGGRDAPGRAAVAMVTAPPGCGVGGGARKGAPPVGAYSAAADAAAFAAERTAPATAPATLSLNTLGMM